MRLQGLREACEHASAWLSTRLGAGACAAARSAATRAAGEARRARVRSEFDRFARTLDRVPRRVHRQVESWSSMSSC